MKDLSILIGGKVVNGLFGLFLFHLIKTFLFPSLYIDFSKTFALLTLMATFTGGAISGLMLKRGFSSAAHTGIVRYWLLFFALLTVLIVELMLAIGSLPVIYRFQVYVYLLSNLLAAIALIDFQMKQQFLQMTLLDTLRLLLPVSGLLLASRFFNSSSLTVGTVLWYLSAGNLYGVYYFLRRVPTPAVEAGAETRHYLRQNWKADLWYSIWFSSFNALFQVLVTVDRQWISKQFTALQASRLAYTADQVCRVANGLIFPINTKISSQLGAYIRQQQFQQFSKSLRTGALLSSGFGLLLTGGWYAGLMLCRHWGIETGIDLPYAILYTLSTALFLSALILQKRFDYTRYKSAPALLLGLAFLLAHVFAPYVPIPVYVLTAPAFFLFILILGHAGRTRLAMDR